LCDQPLARGPERQSDRELATPSAGPGAEEIRQIHTGDEQKKGNGTEQEIERGAYIAHRIVEH
jgi:hypothetical protein